jgi:hypothetical protein
MILHIADGAKGGVGKSQTALILINYLSINDQPIIVFETDTQIPDVARCCEKGKSTTKRNITLYKSDLRSDDGWQSMLETLQELATEEETKNANVVMSLPGADLDVKHYTDLLKMLTEGLDINIWDWFVLNTQKDSVDLLKQSLKNGFASIAKKKIAVKNGMFGNADAFVAFDSDSTKVASKMDKTFYMPGLSAIAATRLRAEKCTIDEVAVNAKTGEGLPKPDLLYSSNIATWAEKNKKELDQIFKGE